MTVPTKNEIRGPILTIAAALSQPFRRNELRASLVKHLSLTESDLREKTTSGKSERFPVRMNWAIHELRQAGLITSPAWGILQITQKGTDFLETHENDLSSALKANIVTDISGDSSTPPTDIESMSAEGSEIESPEESISTANALLEQKLADDMLDSLKSVSPYRFEQLVVDLLEKMGYGEGRPVGGPGDGGIDGIINQDPLGLEKVYIQAKRYDTAQVGEPPIRNFAGSLVAKGASKGVLITTSSFSSPARQTAHTISAGNQFIRLIDGQELARLMINHNVGVVPETTYVIKKLDENYFAEDI